MKIKKIALALLAGLSGLSMVADAADSFFEFAGWHGQLCGGGLARCDDFDRVECDELGGKSWDGLTVFSLLKRKD